MKNSKARSDAMKVAWARRKADAPLYAPKEETTAQMNERFKEHVVEGTPQEDPVNYPSHYTSHPSGVECIQVTEHLNFCVGNAVKYLWRAGEKGSYVQDLAKAVWYIQREIARVSK